MEELRRCAGTQFDPRVVEVLGDVVRARGIPDPLAAARPAPTPSAVIRTPRVARGESDRLGSDGRA